MNRAIRQYKPSSSRMTAGLLTLLVLAFGLFAESHRPTNVPAMFTGTDTIKEIHSQGANGQTRTLFKFH